MAIVVTIKLTSFNEANEYGMVELSTVGNQPEKQTFSVGLGIAKWLKQIGAYDKLKA